MRFAIAVASILLFGAATARSVAAPSSGPAFGSNTYVTTIDPHGPTPDVDDYVAALAAGERLSVVVAATAESTLRPCVRFVDPDGAEVDPGAVARRGGRTLAVRNFAVPASGVWTVRVGAREGTEGAYAVKFKVASPRPLRIAGRLVGGGAPATATYAFHAVEGSKLSLTIRSTGPGAPVLPRSLVDPVGREAPTFAAAVVVKGGVAQVREFPLSQGDGEYRIVVGIDGDQAAAKCTTIVRVAPPARPRGTTSLSAAEPFLAPRGPPLDGTAGSLVRFVGAHFPPNAPYPEVWFGGVRASVVASAPAGTWLDVVPPPNAVGEVVDVTVRNPDGQAATREAYFRYVSPPVLDVAGIDPAQVVLQQGARQRFRVSLTRPAPPLGLALAVTTSGASVGAAPTTIYAEGGATLAAFDVVAAAAPGTGRVAVALGSAVSAEVIVSPPAELASIVPTAVELLEGAKRTFTVTLDGPAPPAGLYVSVSVTGGVATAPAAVQVPGNATSAEFEVTASKVRASGTVVVGSANSFAAAVTVSAPTDVDVSGWTIVQQNSSRTFTIPSGTTLHEGGYLVVGRNATKAAFESFWGRTLGAGVVYVDGLDQWPNINGSETFELRDASGIAVDGPTIAMAAGGGFVYRRTPGAPAAVATAWTSASASPVGNATPGEGQGAAASPAGVYVSEFADANGSGNYVFEFVEVHFDRLP